MSTSEDVAANTHGHNKFSKLDARSEYWMLALNKESSLLITLNTPFGRYKYKRVPFGMICVQETFQWKT